MKFTKQQDLKLISNVALHPVLYKPTSENRDFGLRDRAWKEIHKATGLNVTDMKSRWKNLRDAYMKNNKRRSEPAYSHTKKWKYHKQMKFLSVQNTYSPVSPDVKLNESQYVEIDAASEAEVEEIDDDTLYVDNNIPMENMYPIASVVTQENHVEREQNTSQTSDYVSIMKHFEDIRAKEREEESRREANIHPVDSFFNAMSQVVKSLPPIEQANLRMKICQLVTEAECKMLMQSSGNQSENHPEETSEENVILPDDGTVYSHVTPESSHFTQETTSEPSEELVQIDN